MTLALIVEDDPVTGWGLADLLRANGWRAEWAADGRSGLKKLRIMHPDVLLCDIVLPDMDGRELVRAADGVAGRVVILTGLSGGDAEALRQEFPAAEVLVKPVAPEALVARLVAGDGRATT